MVILLLQHIDVVSTAAKLSSSFFIFSFDVDFFYPRDAVLARVILIATCPSVRPSVYPSVCPARAGIVSKQRKLAS